jgi:hypothetical protein
MISQHRESESAVVAPSLRFRRATRQDTPQLVALLNETFRTPIDERTWEWFVFGNPLGPSRVYLALEENGPAVVGIFGFEPIRLQMQGVALTAAYAHHLVLKPSHRDTTSFVAFSQHALHEESLRSVKLVIGPPNRRAYPVHRTLMKWVDFGFLDCLRKLSPSARPHNCREIDGFSEEFDRFYDRVSQPLSFCLAKNAAWMNWRFCGRPGSPYTISIIRDGEELAGYVVLKRWQEPDGYRKAHIVDLHAVDSGALTHLLAAAESYAGGCEELNLWAVRGYVYRGSLEAMGFQPGRDRQPLIARMLDASSVSFPDGCTSLAYGDGDSQY